MKIAWFGITLALVFLSRVPASCEGSSADRADQIAMPKFMSDFRPLHCALDDEEHHSCMYFESLQQRRADNLFSAGHYEEALAEYSTFLPQSETYIVGISPRVLQNCGEAAERLGRMEDALEYYKRGKYDAQRAKLLIKLGRSDEALKLCEENIAKLAHANQKMIFNKDDQASWLRLRAIIKVKNKDVVGAVEDLKEAAAQLSIHESKEADSCLKSANLLIQKNDLSKSIAISDLTLPKEGKDRIFGLLNFVTTSEDPFSYSEINNLVGSRIKLPDATWIYISSDKTTSAPFNDIEYRGCSDNYKKPDFWSIEINPHKCLLPKTEALTAIPKSLSPAGKQDFWFGDSDLDIVSFKRPSGIIRLRFEKGGLKALRHIDMISRTDSQTSDVFSLWREGSKLAPFNKCGISTSDLKTAVEFLSQAIEKDKEIPDLFRDRARALTKLHRYDEALADTKAAVEIGGIPYIREKAEVESEMGNVKESIADYLKCIGEHKPGPQTKHLWLSLTKVYLKANDFKNAIFASENAMKGSSENTEAKFLRAKAKYGLKERASALVDAEEASKEYFAQARIVKRDEVNSWIRSVSRQ